MTGETAESGKSASGTERSIDKSEPENSGSPKRMARKCLNCDYYETVGCVTVWLEVDNGRSFPRNDVSFKCSECGEVAEQQITILERWPGESEPVGECDGCGVTIYEELNLSTVEVGDSEQQWCPGCRGAAGGGA